MEMYRLLEMYYVYITIVSYTMLFLSCTFMGKINIEIFHNELT